MLIESNVKNNSAETTTHYNRNKCLLLLQSNETPTINKSTASGSGGGFVGTTSQQQQQRLLPKSISSSSISSSILSLLSTSSNKLNLLKASSGAQVATTGKEKTPVLIDFTKTTTTTSNLEQSTKDKEATKRSEQQQQTANKMMQNQITHGLFIRKEIQRFESVHPNIYSVYDLIDSIGDFNLQQQIREHIVNIEDSFVNSQEWTLSRGVPDLKLGIVGSVNSGKSSLVHRFLTGTYIQEESPEGGRFKKEALIDGQSYLLLIRDEGGVPEMQFTHWVDAVIFVFSLENEESFLTAHQYYLKMSNYRNMSDIPFILVGTQDYISESNPRVIDDQRARNLSNELKKCAYYETCASYGLHVERVFQDACQKIITMRSQLLLSIANVTNPTSTNGHVVNAHALTPLAQTSSTASSIRLLAGSHINSTNNGASSQQNGQSAAAATSVAAMVQVSVLNFNGASNGTSPSGGSTTVSPQAVSTSNGNHVGPANTPPPQLNSLSYYLANPHLINTAALHTSSLLACQQQQNQHQPIHSIVSQPVLSQIPTQMPNILNQGQNHLFKEPYSMQHTNGNGHSHNHVAALNDKKCSAALLQPDTVNPTLLVTPCSTPNQKRKDNNRRRSNLFTPNKKEDKQNKINDMGIGRSIPVKQGFLYKKTNSTINKDWKKKFVTLNDDGSLRYYPSMNDYMEETHGKEIDLQKTTIKIPGANKPRIGKSVINLDANKLNNEISTMHISGTTTPVNNSTSTSVSVSTLADFKGTICPDDLPNSHHTSQPVLTNGMTINQTNDLARVDINSKKRHRRIKSNHKSDQNKDEEQEGFEFIIVSLDNKQWHFEAASAEEREEWVQAIEQQILSSLQSNETNKLKGKHAGFTADNLTKLTMKNVPGNSACADCDAPNPVWASLNHGELICIECSGIHRNLGTHLSRVRSLELDDWSNDLVQIMTSIGNRMINSIYEANTKPFGKNKPNANAAREDKEKWIRTKYESKQFLASLPSKDIQVGKQLLEAVSRQDIAGVILCLAHSKPEDVNCCVSQLDKRTSLHIAASMSNLVILQLLIWYGADVECVDNSGRTALAYARNSNSPECIQILLHNNCPEGVQSTNTLGRKLNCSVASTSHIIQSVNSGLNSNGMYDKISFNAV